MPKLNSRRDPAYSPSGRRYARDPDSPVRRSKRLEVGSASPSSSMVLRVATPDARQLHETLRAASESPVKEGRGNGGGSSSRSRARKGSFHSSVTPSPPVQRTISTASTPSAPSLNPAIATGNDAAAALALEQQNDRGFSFFRYPRLSSIGFGRKAASPVGVSSSPQVDDGDSVISWQLERELHGDNLQRTPADDYARESEEGRSIRAPPRRLSGLTWTNDTTHSADKSNTTVDNDVDDDDDDDDDGDAKSETPEIRAAAVKTVISTAAVHNEFADGSVAGSVRPSTAGPIDRHRRPAAFTVLPNAKGEIKWSLCIGIVLAAILVASLAATTHFLSDHLEHNNNPFTDQPKTNPTFNNTDGQIIITQLSNEVDRLGVQISSVSQDVRRLSFEQRQIADHATVVSPVPAELEPRINFLSLGLGTRVDPLLTSPSIGTRRTLPRRLYEGLSGKYMPLPNPPEVALETWDDIGDCWCSAPGQGGQAQLALELGERAIVDEVVVEHIPASASLDPSVAPREMELWARFKPFHHGPYSGQAPQNEAASTKRSGWFGLFRSSSSPPSSSSVPPTSFSSLPSLLDAIMKTLQQAYPSEMETAYANDRLLGPSYFRLGKWEYDRVGDAVQHFALNALIDYPTLRVDKVVVRVKSNWGGNHTCLYRVKLHGHV